MQATVASLDSQLAAATAAGDKARGRVARLKADLGGAASLADAQNAEVARLEAALAASSEDRAALQRSAGGLLGDLEAARGALEAAVGEYAEAVGASYGGGGGVRAGLSALGVDTAALVPPDAVAAAAGLAAPQPQPGGGSSPVPGLAVRAAGVVRALLGALASAAQRISALLAEAAALRGELGALSSRVAAVDEVAAGSAERARALAAAEAKIAGLRADAAAARAAEVSRRGGCVALRSPLRTAPLHALSRRTRRAPRPGCATASPTLTQRWSAPLPASLAWSGTWRRRRRRRRGRGTPSRRPRRAAASCMRRRTACATTSPACSPTEGLAAGARGRCKPPRPSSQTSAPP